MDQGKTNSQNKGQGQTSKQTNKGPGQMGQNHINPPNNNTRILKEIGEMRNYSLQIIKSTMESQNGMVDKVNNVTGKKNIVPIEGLEMSNFQNTRPSDSSSMELIK